MDPRDTTDLAHLDFDASTFCGTARLFPLPNLVLYPHVMQPLHIFEERYKAMTADALRGDGVIAMALLKHGWEKCYYAAPSIEPVVCVGKILTHEKLPDGNYNFLLQGIARARVVAEDRSRAYRVGRLELLADADVMEIDLENERLRLTSMLSEGICANLPVVKQFRQMLTSTMPTAEIAAPTIGIATAAQTRPGCSRPWSPLRPIIAMRSAARATRNIACQGCPSGPWITDAPKRDTSQSPPPTIAATPPMRSVMTTPRV
jgi:Lon protease-like protein